MTMHLTPTHLLAGLGALLTLVVVWRSGARTARGTARAARAGARLMSLASRVLGTTAGIVAVQWLVFAYSTSTLLRLVTLAVPALFAAYTLARALTVTTTDAPRRRGERR